MARRRCCMARAGSNDSESAVSLEQFQEGQRCFIPVMANPEVPLGVNPLTPKPEPH